METRTLFDPDGSPEVASGATAARRQGGPPGLAGPQSRIRALNGQRRALQSDDDRVRRRESARRRARARVEEMDDESRAEWSRRLRSLRIVT